MTVLTPQRGFTLIEAIVVMVITGVIAAIVAAFIPAPVKGYVDAARRARLTDTADTAIRRIVRDVRLAVPNSIRLPNGAAAGQCFEMLPTTTGGMARTSCGTDNCAGQDPLEVGVPDTSFDVLAGLGVIPAAGDQVVIHNLGIPGADAYEGSNRAGIVSATASKITLASGSQFPLASPGDRFSIVSGAEQAVFYVCAGVGADAAGNGTGALYRLSSYGINSATPAACPAVTAGALLADHVSACQFSYGPGVNQRNAQLTVQLRIQHENESAQLYQEVHIQNVP